MLQVPGLLGTSHLLDFLARGLPGHQASRLAERPSLEEAAEGAGGLVALLLRDAVAVAVVEELLFRGVLFEGLRRMLGLRAALFGSAALFGIAHFDLHLGIAAALLGLQLAAMRAAFGLPLAIVAHAFNNAVALLTRGAAPAGLETTATSAALAALVAASAIAICVRRLRRGDEPRGEH